MATLGIGCEKERMVQPSKRKVNEEVFIHSAGLYLHGMGSRRAASSS